jgi:Ca2+ transporting ATPase
MEAPWTKSPKEVLDFYAVDPSRGLSKDQVDKHAQLYGRNGMYIDITRRHISIFSSAA